MRSVSRGRSVRRVELSLEGSLPSESRTQKWGDLVGASCRGGKIKLVGGSQERLPGPAPPCTPPPHPRSFQCLVGEGASSDDLTCACPLSTSCLCPYCSCVGPDSSLPSTSCCVMRDVDKIKGDHWQLVEGFTVGSTCFNGIHRPQEDLCVPLHLPLKLSVR